MCDLEDTVPLDSPCAELFVIITWRVLTLKHYKQSVVSQSATFPGIILVQTITFSIPLRVPTHANAKSADDISFNH